MAFSCTTPAVPTVQQDDETVRITRSDFPAGATTGWPRHGWLYFVVMLTTGTLRLHDGRTVRAVPLAAGESSMRPAGVAHDLMNGSPHPIAAVEIEVKRPAALASLALGRKISTERL